MTCFLIILHRVNDDMFLMILGSSAPPVGPDDLPAGGVLRAPPAGKSKVNVPRRGFLDPPIDEIEQISKSAIKQMGGPPFD
jgi:hypothetical protein